MQPELPFDPLQLMLQALFQALDLLWSFPWWTKLLLGTLIIGRLMSPDLFETDDRHRRRFRRRHARSW
jgi:hypothetical protein